MYKINAIGSSSSGNTFIVSDGVTNIVLDIGMNTEKIQSGLFKLNYKSSDIHGVLVSHGHQDHIQGALALKSAPKYMSQGTYEESKKYNIPFDTIKIVKEDETFKIGTFTIKPFKVKHDSKEPLGYIMSNVSGETLFYMTDSGIANVHFPNADVYIIEANHSEKTLKQKMEEGKIDPIRYERVANCHLSTEKAIKYLSKNIGENTKQVVLMHLSPNNTNPIGLMNYVKAKLDYPNVAFVHPVSHNIKKGWKVGFEPKNEREF